MSTLPITVALPSTGRRPCLWATVEKILACEPLPAQVLVHLDAPPPGVRQALQEKFPTVEVLTSTSNVGPGGGRARLIESAAHALVASFDDDSYPDTSDYFARAWETAQRFPEAAVISAASSELERKTPGFMRIAVYSGCGCVFRRSWMLKAPGFVPLPIAYGMEEADVSLQLHAMDGVIVHDPHLHVRHDHPPGESRDVGRWNAAILANTMLLPWLRYPFWLLPAGLAQVINRVVWMIRHGHADGLLRGLGMMPIYLWRHRRFRKVLPAEKVGSWFRLRRHPCQLGGKNTVAV